MFLCLFLPLCWTGLLADQFDFGNTFFGHSMCAQTGSAEAFEGDFRVNIKKNLECFELGTFIFVSKTSECDPRYMRYKTDV